jgi:hypothetical protein
MRLKIGTLTAELAILFTASMGAVFRKVLRAGFAGAQDDRLE